MATRVTLQDIANHCGFSKSMVAQVMRDPQGSSAKLKTKSIIIDTAKKFNYRSNLAAKALSTNKSYTIGVLMPSIGGFYYELAVELERILTEHGYYSLFSYWTATDEMGSGSRQAFNRIIEHGVDGIITVQYDEAFAELGIPVVTYGNERRLMDCVYPDKIKSLDQAVEYLQKRGHRKIGFMGMHDDVRGLGIRDILANNALEINPNWIVDCYTLYEDGYNSLKKIHAAGTMPSAIIAHSDLVAIGAIKYADEAGINIPGDISIISYDNLTQAAYTIPALTSFDQCYEKGAFLLVKAIMNRIKNPKMPQQKYSIEMPLIERDSVRILNKKSKVNSYKSVDTITRRLKCLRKRKAVSV